MSKRQFGTPHLISDLSSEGRATPLQRLQLSAQANKLVYDERFLQELIFAQPEILPVDEIEPVFSPLMPVAMEVQTPSSDGTGYIDNLFVSPEGALTIVECKLWRNPESRREVVGQILDYAKELAHWSYEDLEAAIQKSTGRPPGYLYECANRRLEAVEEVRFIDNVSRNLRWGRFLLLVVGDGIRESTERIAAFVQEHSGLHFTIGLVELALFRIPGHSGLLAQPRVLGRTVNVERGIVRVVDERIIITPSDGLIDVVPPPSKRTTISEEEFFAHLAKVAGSLPAQLRSFLSKAEPLGVVAEFQKNLILRWNPDGEHKFNLGVIRTDGTVRTDPINWVPDAIGALDLAHDYLDRLAKLVDGAFVKQVEKQASWYVRTAEKDHIPLEPMLQRQAEWLSIMADYLDGLRPRLPQDS